uniref:Uncharacterized protein n=1 Tax=Ditylenchus dipsaci TaxID=166011 RepID=A0A915EJX3_9BILA
MLLLLGVLNVVFWPMYLLGCGKIRRWRQKKKESKQKPSTKKQQPSLIPVTPHPQQLKTPEDVKPDQTPMRAGTGTPGTASVRLRNSSSRNQASSCRFVHPKIKLVRDNKMMWYKWRR